MKNGLAKPAILRISSALKQVLPQFNENAFIDDCLDNIESLELKERVNHLIAILHQYLPQDFSHTAQALTNIVPIWDFGDPDDALRSFAAWPLIDYIAEHGIECPDIAIPLMKTLTALFSAEFAIRPFILKYPKLCHQHLILWCQDDDHHVRRLVSEGTRPRLPWGIQLKPFVNDPTPTKIYLDTLKDDTSLYVRRSVANHLNDIAKDHPDVVINMCQHWLSQCNNKPTDDLQWLIKQATRTLVKKGIPEVFPLLGYTNKPKIKAEVLTCTPEITLGDALSFTLEIKSTTAKNQRFVIDYAIHFVKANGATNAKVFKLKNVDLAAKQTLVIDKSHAIRPISTRKYYPGKHVLEILVNGESKASQSFILQMTE